MSVSRVSFRGSVAYLTVVLPPSLASRIAFLRYSGALDSFAMMNFILAVRSCPWVFGCIEKAPNAGSSPWFP